MCFHMAVSHLLIRYILQRVKKNVFTLVACWSALILVITRNCDAKVDSTLQFYQQRSFPLREMLQNAVPPWSFPLSVHLFSFFWSIYLSFPAWHGREGWVLCTYWRGVCIPVGLSILFLSSPPPAPVSSCAARTLPLALHLPPLSYPSSGHPAYSRTSHCSSQENVTRRLVTTNNPAQPWTKCSWRCTGRAAFLEVRVLWFFFPLSLHLASDIRE